MPGLVLIDGGLGQLHAAAEALEAIGIVDQPLASIAKREEIIYVYGQEDEPVVLDRFSPILHLIQSIRDEAHRFAVTFHRSLRNTRQLTSELDAIPGVGKKTVQKLLKEFGSLERVRAATESELAMVVGRAAARRVIAHYLPVPETPSPPRHEKIMYMRFRQLGAVLVFCLAAAAQTQTLTLDQLMKFLTSSVELKMSDSDVAKFLVKAKLSEKLDDATIEKLLAGRYRPEDAECAAHAARPVAVPVDGEARGGAARRCNLPPAPNAIEQAAIIDEVREYALNYSKSLPNFLSTQVVRRYQAGAPGSRYDARYQRTLLGAGGSADAALELLRPEGRVQADPAQQQPDHAGLQERGRRHLHRRIRQPAARHFRASHARALRVGRLGAPARSTGDGLPLQRGAGQFAVGHRVRAQGSHRPGIQRAHPDRQGHSRGAAHHAECRQSPADVPGEDGDHHPGLRLRGYQRPASSCCR